MYTHHNHTHGTQPKGRRFWTALRKAPIDPRTNLHVCFAFNRGE